MNNLFLTLRLSADTATITLAYIFLVTSFGWFTAIVLGLAHALIIWQSELVMDEHSYDDE